MNKPNCVVVYPCKNRLYYTQFTLPRVIEECHRSLDVVGQLRIYDANSHDGTQEFYSAIPITKSLGEDRIYITRGKYNNSVFQINDTVAKTDYEYIIKIDNDILASIGCIHGLLNIMTDPKYSRIGFLGMADTKNEHFPTVNPEVKIQYASHIGGVGIFRRKVFQQLGHIHAHKRFYGFTAYQVRAKKIHKWRTAWALNVEMMDLNKNRAFCLQTIYAEKGYGRRTGKFTGVMEP